MKNRVAFVLYSYPLGVSSMIVNSIKMFADNGIDVDIYIDKLTYDESPVDFKQRNIKIIIYDNAWVYSFSGKVFFFGCLYIASFLFLRFLFNIIKRYYNNIPSGLFYLYYMKDYFFSKWLFKKIEKDYDYIFPVEVKSLIAVSHARNNIIYYNMEILDWSEENPIYGKDKKLLKLLEHKALQNVSAAVIQNDRRAEQFQKINNFNKEIHILPVASMGEPIYSKDSFFREKYSIPQNTHVVIYSGNIMPWAKCIEIVDSVREWPGNFCLVLHTWRKNVFKTEYGFKVKEHAKGLPVYFSEDYLDIDDLAKCLSSADIALMFYEGIDANFIEILFSSNKLAEYLKAGLPVVTFDYTELKRFFDEQGIGKTISTMDELPKALLQIMDKHKIYNKNVVECYQNVFRFEKFFESFYKELYSTQETRRGVCSSA